jgi:hypothetical protein
MSGDRTKTKCFFPYSNLKYAQVCKRKEKGRIIEAVQRVVFGDPEEVSRLIGAESDANISTAYMKRFNFTIRNSLARFIRRGKTAANFS